MRNHRVVNYDEFNKHCSGKVKTYSLVFSVYTIENGLQNVLFSTTDRDLIVPKCKELSIYLSKIFVSEDFHSNKIYKFKL